MSFIRPIRSSLFRPTLAAVPRTQLQVRLAHQDYGSGKGNPAGERPEKQGKNPSEEIEHPGPPPPNVGKGKSPSPNEKSSSSNNQSKSSSPHSQTSPSSQSQSQANDGATKGGATTSKVKGAQPKILNANPPTGQENEDVRRHNEEMDHRAEKAHEQVSNEEAKKDKAPPGFWSGQGGRDKDP